MPVSLKIVAFKGQPYENGEAVIIDREGGIIGRQDSCDLFLPDTEKIISRHHAKIGFENDAFMLSDTSLGGTFIDENPVPLNQTSIKLVDGMILGIGEYQIQVSLLPDSAGADEGGDAGPFAEPDSSPFAEDDDLLNLSAEAEPSAEMPAESRFTEQVENPFLSEQQDDFSPDYEKHDQFSSLHDSYIPPEPTGEKHANDEIPEDFNFEELFNLEPQSSNNQPAAPAIEPQQQDNVLLDQQAPPIADESLRPAEPELVKPSPAPFVSGAAEGAAPNLYQAFLAGAGLDQADIRPAQQDDKMRRIGSMFRQFVESTVAVLRSRAEFKSLFRVTVTTIKKADNNPLKFSVTTDEALQHLLNDGKGGFMDSVDAIDEGFQDMLNHQMAMQAGIQASLSEILRQFEPDRIEKQYEEGLVLNKKAKCWEKYCDVYAQLAEQAVEDFYGDAFAEAYEQQMKQIRAVNPKK